MERMKRMSSYTARISLGHDASVRKQVGLQEHQHIAQTQTTALYLPNGIPPAWTSLKWNT
eukprot:1156732-Pelagomonas_calceolata.AAC.3